jgi:hypothetical protein
MGWEGLFSRSMYLHVPFVYFHLLSGLPCERWLITGMLRLHCDGILRRWRYVSVFIRLCYISCYCWLSVDSVLSRCVLSCRAELMKKANGTYFPEEVISYYRLFVLLISFRFMLWANNIKMCANCSQQPSETAEMVRSVGSSCWLLALELCFTPGPQGKWKNNNDAFIWFIKQTV